MSDIHMSTGSMDQPRRQRVITTLSLNVVAVIRFPGPGLEPTIPSSVGRCVIHWVTGLCGMSETLEHSFSGLNNATSIM
eukprot:3094991-Amphidinium_carterae.1